MQPARCGGVPDEVIPAIVFLAYGLVAGERLARRASVGRGGVFGINVHYR